MMREAARILVPVFLAAQLSLVDFAAGRERLPAAPELSRFPVAFQDWARLREDPLEPEIVQELRADQLRSQIYAHRPPVLLSCFFLAWFQSQRGVERQPHSPK